VKRGGGARGAAAKAAAELPGLPPDFLTAESSVADEAVIEPSATRTRAAAPTAVDLACDVPPGHTAILAIRHQSGALTFHPPVQSVSRTARGPSQIAFRVQLNQPATRGLIGSAIKAIVIKVAKMGVDKGVSVLLPRLAEAVEKSAWKKRGLTEGWHTVSRETIAAGTLEPAAPVSPARSLLFLHGTFSDAAGAFSGLVKTDFFERVKSTYGDRIFAFNHFSVSRTPEQNARMLLEGLPEQATVFDVVTHSRGGLVLRTLIESAERFGGLGRRFTPGRIVLVASPNDGTPLATPKHLDDTIGLIANLLEMFPDNPFTTGTSFVANGLVWLANHVTGDLPGLRAMDADGELIATEWLVDHDLRIGQDEAFALLPRHEHHGTTALCAADAVGRDVAGKEPHDVIHRQRVVDDTAGAVDVEVDILVLLHALQVEHLHDDAGRRHVIDLADQEDHAVFVEHFLERHFAVAVISPASTRAGGSHGH
jgi:hypothetical protein